MTGRFVVVETRVDRRTHDRLPVTDFDVILHSGVDIGIEPGSSGMIQKMAATANDWNLRWIAEFQGAWAPKWALELREVVLRLREIEDEITSGAADTSHAEDAQIGLHPRVLWGRAIVLALASGDPPAYVEGFPHVVESLALLTKKSRWTTLCELFPLVHKREPPGAGGSAPGGEDGTGGS